MRDFLLPDVGEGLAEAELLAWLVSVGDVVVEGQPIAEVSTDKVNVELPSPCDGVIRELPWQPHDVIQVGAVLARIEESGSGQGGPSTEQPSSSEPVSKEPASGEAAASPTGPAQPASTELPSGEPVAARPSAVVPPQEVAARRVVAAPSTRKLAHDMGVDLRTVKGSGPGGRILRSDVLHAAEAGLPDAQTPRPEGRSDGEQIWQALPLTGVRLTSAKRLEHSARTYATATSTFQVPGDGLVRLRKVLHSEVEDEQVGTLALLVKAVAAALRRNPRFNAQVDEERRALLVGERIDIAIAVATEHGLTVPVVRDVLGKSAKRVHAEVRELSERARAQRLAPVDLEGATFTVSSTGAMEQARVLSTTPIINPPQVSTLWLSRIVDVPRVMDGQLEVGPMLTGSLSFDHRFIDGAEAAAMLNDLAWFLEHPERALA